VIRISRDDLIILSAHFFFFLNFSELILLPKYLILIGLSPAETGMVMGSFSVAVVAALPVVGLMSEAVSRRWLFMAGSVLMALPTVFYPEMTGMTAGLFILRILQGAGFACSFGITGAIVSDNSPTESKYLLGVLTVVGLLTQAVGPTLGEYLISVSGYHALFFSAALFGLVAGGLAFLLPTRASAYPGRRGDMHYNSGSLISTIVLGVIFGSMVIFLPPYLVTRGVNNSSPFFLGFVLGGLLVWTVFYRMFRARRGRALWILMSVLLVIPLLYARAPGFLALFAVSLLSGIGYGYLYPTLNAGMIEMNRTAKGMANALFVWSFNVGMFLASVGFGYLCESAGYQKAFLLTAVAGFIILVMSGLAYKRYE
jgi:MFS family permease